MSQLGPLFAALFVVSLCYTAWQARGVREFFMDVGYRLTLMVAVLARLHHLSPQGGNHLRSQWPTM